MKPKLNRVVYTIYRSSITKSTVAFVGNETFIIEHWLKDYAYGYEFYYKDYGITWFTSFSKAKKQILEDEKYWDNEPCKLKQFAEDYWEVVYDG